MTTVTGYDYNPMTQTFDWTDETWEEYVKKYPKARQFRYKPLANAEELETLFSGVLAAGSNTWSSGMDNLAEAGNLSSIFETPMPNETSIKVEDDDNGPKTHASYYNFDQPSINEV
ncbi:hypothetical protein AB3S75_019560 [Citrus x aurantiifolia]